MFWGMLLIALYDRYADDADVADNTDFVCYANDKIKLL